MAKLTKYPLKPSDIQKLCCQVTLFNRQQWKLEDGKAKRMAKDYDTGKEIAILTQDIRQTKQATQFCSQIKLIRFDGKIVAKRLSSGSTLEVNLMVFRRMQQRQKLLKEAEITYRQLQKKEAKDFFEKVIHYAMMQNQQGKYAYS